MSPFTEVELIRLLSSTEVSARQFGEWSMGYRRVDADEFPAGAGYSDFLCRENPGPSWNAPTPARVLLDWFRLHAGETTASAPPSLYAMR